MRFVDNVGQLATNLAVVGLSHLFELQMSLIRDPVRAHDRLFLYWFWFLGHIQR